MTGSLDGGSLDLNPKILTSIVRMEDAVLALAYAASIALDFALNEVRILALTGDITFTTSNLQPGRKKTVIISCDGSIRNFTFPAWIFIGGSAPTTIAANKTAVLTVYSPGTTDAACVASYAVQP